jgi:hypothetical protein
VLDVFVFAPAGLVLTAVEDLPEVVSKGRSRLEGHIRNARFVGQLVVGRGQHELRQRLNRVSDQETRPSGLETDEMPGERDDRATSVSEPSASEPSGSEPSGSEPSVSAGTPMSAGGSGLTTDGPSEGTDASGEGQATRTSTEPVAPVAAVNDIDGAIPGYDTLPASHVVRRLDGLGHQELEAIGRYEAATRGRRTILHRVQQLLNAEAPPAEQG